MKRSQFVRLGLLAPLAPVLLAGHSQTASAAAIKAADFVSKAGIAGQFEIESSQLAEASAQREDVKSFARHMIKDHTIAAQELKATAGSKYTVPAKLDDKHQQMIDELKAAGSGIDALYIKMQVAAHKEAVELFAVYGKSGDDAALQAFAVKTLPTLQMHNDMITKINNTQT